MEAVKRKNCLSFYILLFCAFVFILERDACASGAQKGISFCLYGIIPAVFPYTAVCKMLVKSGCVGHLGIITTGLLCGFPTGANMCSEMYKNGRLDKHTAEVLCAVTNGMTPTFVIGFVGVYCTKSTQTGILVYVICAFSAVLYAVVSKIGLSPRPTEISQKPFYDVFTESIHETILSVMSLCGYVIFFSVVCEFLKVFAPFLPSFVLPLVFLFSEITTGIFNIGTLGTVLSGRMFFSLLCAAVSFSGVCVHMQVISVCKYAGLSAMRFVTGKCIQSAFSFFISYIVYGIIFG